MEEGARVYHRHLTINLHKWRFIFKDIGWNEGRLDLALILEELIAKLKEFGAEVGTVAIF
jgi:hypothetical protein